MSMIENLQSISAKPVQAVGGAGGARGANGRAFPALGEYGRGDDSLSLSPEAQAQLRELKQRDAEVRAHERAHMAAAGPYSAGGPSYEYQRGPDGRQYAIGGHVDIDASAIEGDPRASEEKARQVKRAALAPGEPSGQDRAVAARASVEESRAQHEQREEEAENMADMSAGEGKFARSPMLQAAEAYAQMARRGVMPTALAPGGTGISMQI